jgi:hypothetical protein
MTDADAMQSHIESLCDLARNGDEDAIKSVCVIAMLKSELGYPVEDEAS